MGKEGDNFLYSFASLAKRDVSNTRRKQEKEKAPEFRVFPPEKFPKFNSYDGILLSNYWLVVYIYDGGLVHLAS